MPQVLNQRGQLLLPMLTLMFLFALILAGYLRWCRRQYWTMRMSIAAEATALSVARSQAGILNKISVDNLALNTHVGKLSIPADGPVLGGTTENGFFKLVDATDDLKNQVDGFSRAPAAIGTIVSRENGARDIPSYAPHPMKAQLVPRGLWVTIALPHPPFVAEAHLENGFYARAWSPNVRHAQPHHTTTWRVSNGEFCGVATARLWLDVASGDPVANGGFPRPNESLAGGIGVQDLYPQFNARLAPTQGWFKATCP